MKRTFALLAGVLALFPLRAQAEDLPLYSVSGGLSHAPVAAVYLTGDGGWAPFDQRVVANLAKAGVPTSALDTGDYFRVMRDQNAAATDLARNVRGAMSRWQAQKIIGVGYSFGADVAPFLVARLSADLRARIDRVALNGPSEIAPFQVTAAERVGLVNPGARPVKPALAALVQDGVRVVCVYGQNDHDTICPTREGRGMTRAALAGGQGFKGDDAAVARAILAP